MNVIRIKYSETCLSRPQKTDIKLKSRIVLHCNVQIQPLKIMDTSVYCNQDSNLWSHCIDCMLNQLHTVDQTTNKQTNRRQLSFQSVKNFNLSRYCLDQEYIMYSQYRSTITWKSGHPYNQDTFAWSQAIRIIQVLLYDLAS